MQINTQIKRWLCATNLYHKMEFFESWPKAQCEFYKCPFCPRGYQFGLYTKIRVWIDGTHVSSGWLKDGSYEL